MFLVSSRFAVILSLALAATGLQAAPPKKEATLGGGKGSGPIMQMNELRACVKRQAGLKSMSDETVKAQQQMTTDRAAIEEGGAAIKVDMEKLDRTDQEAVAAFLERTKAHDQRIDDYQARVPAFNGKVEALNAEREGYAKACEGRRYLEDDLKDIKAGK